SRPRGSRRNTRRADGALEQARSHPLQRRSERPFVAPRRGHPRAVPPRNARVEVGGPGPVLGSGRRGPRRAGNRPGRPPRRPGEPRGRVPRAERTGEEGSGVMCALRKLTWVELKLFAREPFALV